MTGAIEIVTHPLASGYPPEWASGWGQDEFGVFAAFTVGRVTQRMRWIAPGDFWMGSPEDEAQRASNETRHRVRISEGYWLADTACSQALYREVTKANPSRFDDDDACPVENVSWDDAVAFMARLAARTPTDDGLEWRLPTEAEWEYACRAGTETPFVFGKTITTEQVNYDGNHPYAGGPKGAYRKRTVPVGSLPANPWGLYEMHGNVWEWCADWYGSYGAGTEEDPLVDPTGPSEGSSRVQRGGSWISHAQYCRSARRSWWHWRVADGSGGFRLARGPGVGSSSR